MPINRTYGWRPDKPDIRDQYLDIVAPFETLPQSVDLRPFNPPIYDQGSIGSCTSCALARIFQINEIKQKNPHIFTPSRLYIYYNERSIEGTIAYDAGAELRDGIKALCKWGACDEKIWPYVESKFTTKPNKSAYLQGSKNKISKYQRVRQDLNSMKTCLAHNNAFVIGITVYESFESDQVAQTGIVPMPDRNESSVGGHAIAVVGYDDHLQTFLCANSWGDWGMKGYFTIPYDYLTDPNLACDLWTIINVPIS